MLQGWLHSSLPLLTLNLPQHLSSQIMLQEQQMGIFLKPHNQLRIHTTGLGTTYHLFLVAPPPLLITTLPLSIYTSGDRKGRPAHQHHCPGYSCPIPAVVVGSGCAGSWAHLGTITAAEQVPSPCDHELVGNNLG